MDVWGAVLVGVSSSLVASVMFLGGMRLLFAPKLAISGTIAIQRNRADAEVYRVKIVNLRRFTDAVHLRFELVAMSPIAGNPGESTGLDPFKFERAPMDVRPETLVSIPPYRRGDRRAAYALGITTSEGDKIRAALDDPSSLIRFRVYAEHAWSRRGKTFDRTFATPAQARRGDFYLGRDLRLVTEED